MLGWWFCVRLNAPKESPVNIGGDEHLLATWETGVSGFRWIEDLVAKGIAQKQLGGGYPNRYVVPAAPVLSLLLEQMQRLTPSPLYSSDWREGKFVTAAITACPMDAQLVVEAWDQS